MSEKKKDGKAAGNGSKKALKILKDTERILEKVMKNHDFGKVDYQDIESIKGGIMGAIQYLKAGKDAAPEEKKEDAPDDNAGNSESTEGAEGEGSEQEPSIESEGGVGGIDPPLEVDQVKICTMCNTVSDDLVESKDEDGNKHLLCSTCKKLVDEEAKDAK